MSYNFKVYGKHNTATVFTNVIENEAISQIINICNQDWVEDSQIRIMPDVHAGKGCVIGYTMNIKDKVCPNLVGVDISCGMLVVKLPVKEIDCAKLDGIIRKYVPVGNCNAAPIKVEFKNLEDLYCYSGLKHIDYIKRSIGSLGSPHSNHFIEVDKAKDGTLYLVIHSGSRNLGKQVAEYYQNIAFEQCRGTDNLLIEKKELIKHLRAEGRHKEINDALRKLYEDHAKKLPKYPKDLCCLSGTAYITYLHDVKICQQWANLNRVTMANEILRRMFGCSLEDCEHFTTLHNYIDFSGEEPMMRKGAVSAKEDEILLIPINMRDGSLLCRGKGNPEWNYSAPHGAGRLMSRSKAKETLNLSDFKDTMKDVWTSSVGKETLDEAPMAYKSIDDIVNNIEDTVEIIDILKPIYNFKAS